eukprot:15440698-Alexandrium_andersonii.AAC.1
MHLANHLDIKLRTRYGVNRFPSDDSMPSGGVRSGQQEVRCIRVHSGPEEETITLLCVSPQQGRTPVHPVLGIMVQLAMDSAFQ